MFSSFLRQWFVSGNINCFHGWHAPLGILAILSLAFCVSIVVIIVLYAFKWLEVGVTYVSVGLSTHWNNKIPPSPATTVDSIQCRTSKGGNWEQVHSLAGS